MIQVQRFAPLSAALIRRRPALPERAAGEGIAVESAPPAGRDWLGDLRFFLTCYAAGIAFFLVMLN